MRKTTTAVLALSAAVAITASATAQTCLTQTERTAMAMRHIQTQLMVGALACRGDSDMGQRDLYTQFVLGNKHTLGRHGRALRSYFARLYGPDAQTRLDRHVTGVANRISREAGRQHDFCERILAFGENILKGDLASTQHPTLLASAPVPFNTDQPVCESGTTASLAE